MRFRSHFSVVAGVALSVGAQAQMHHVDKPERVTRAIGVYEWTGDLTKPSAARFVPVSLFIDGHFEDAGLYLARPVPFALQNGNLYTIEHAGQPEGLLDLDQAERIVSGNALADDNPTGAWYGFGKFTAEAPPKAAPTLHRSAHVGVIQASAADGSAKPHPEDNSTAKDTGTQTDDGKPHMSRRNDSGDTGSTGASGDQTTGGSTGKSSTPDSADDTDRPTLRRRDPAQDASRRKTAIGGKAGTASVTAVGPAPGDDPDRPVLGRSKEADTGPKVLTGMPADLQQAVAVSDPAQRDPHPFARPWQDAAERASTLILMESLAKPQAAAYLAENRFVPSSEVVATPEPSRNTEGMAANTENGAGGPPKLQRGKPSEYGSEGATATKPATTAANPDASRKSPAVRASSRTLHKAPTSSTMPLTFTHEDVSGFALSYGGLPTFVYTASVPAAVAQPKDGPPAANHATVFVTVVAQRLPSGELQVALRTATDSLHLDRSPRLHLIDAVDPDASHRASLLFELRGSSSRQFALYRLITAKAENTFVSALIE